MFKRTIFFSIICFATLCLSSAPALGNLFHFNVNLLDMTFDGTRFDATLYYYSEFALTRDVAPVETVDLDPWRGGLGLGGLSLWMDLDNITSDTATAIGQFTITDIDGDTITGDLTGNWERIGYYPYFSGGMSDIQWTSDDGFFDGNFGSDDSSMPLDLVSGPPWDGTIIELTTGHTLWFTYPWTGKYARKVGGSFEGVVTPTPTAVILGILGLGVVGYKLRKYA
ncbi:MAG: hypothetical protein JSV03_08220 [Planctomycetota bacterium]|nr:MAG: hypothetical protein JSV03_08220 [Planctomycetota bacterium]